MDNIKSTLKKFQIRLSTWHGGISNRDTIQEKIIKVI